MHSRQMVKEDLIIEVVLLTEVTPWMRQDLGLLIITWISLLNMIGKLLDVIESLLSDKD
jgi:hypothetical protein